MKNFWHCAWLCLCLGVNNTHGDTTTNNQTDTLSPILPQPVLPFKISIEKADFQLPGGLHSGVVGTYKGLWILMAGRNNGLHGFPTCPPPTIPPAFPVQSQNDKIYVVNPATGETVSRALTDPSSGLTQEQVEVLSVTNPEGFQASDTLYMAGGYGYNSSLIDTEAFDTKPVLSAMYLPGIVDWVLNPSRGNALSSNIRQITDPVFQVAGGEMFDLGNRIQLAFGQNFIGEYCLNNSGESTTGIYNEQIRQFEIVDGNGNFSVRILPPKPIVSDPNLHRRDLNIVPVLLNQQTQLQQAFVAYSGVFYPYTDPEAPGVWTVPVLITKHDDPQMADPADPSTFKQGMNNYVSATASLYSKKSKDNYTIIFGGESYGYYEGGTFQTDPNVRNINQVTTIKMDKSGHFSQYLMDAEFPFIPASSLGLQHPDNPLLFGTSAYFFPNHKLLQYANHVISLDSIRKPTLLGYIVGGITSSLPDTTDTSIQTAASPYVFKVMLMPNA